MGESPASSPLDRTSINVQGVIALRWVAVIGQFFTILAVNHLLSVKLPMQPLLTVLAATGALNLLLIQIAKLPGSDDSAVSRRRWDIILWATMLFDLLALTAQLFFTGGVTNPFSMFYFVNLVLAAMVLPTVWVWSLNVVSVGCVAFLMLNYQPLQLYEEVTWENLAGSLTPNVLKLGTLVAYSTCATVIVLFTNRISEKLRSQELRNRQLADQQNRSERLEALGTLAAGAAHELSTPLSSIAIIIKEVEHSLENRQLPSQTFEDIQTIRSQLDRCRSILDRMSVDSGDAFTDGIVETTIGKLIEESVKPTLLSQGKKPGVAVRLKFEDSSDEPKIRMPLQGLAQALRAIIQNAIDASASGSAIHCTVTSNEGGFRVIVSDSGHGMDEATLRRIGQPFFTTKETGKGTGLGIYLARNAIERLGGRLTFQSESSVGTTATVWLPFQMSAVDANLVDADSPGLAFLRNTVGLDLGRRKSQ